MHYACCHGKSQLLDDDTQDFVLINELSPFTNSKHADPSELENLKLTASWSAEGVPLLELKS